MQSILPRASENPFLENDLGKYVPTTKTEEWKYTNIQSIKEHLVAPEKSWQTSDIEKLLPVVSGPTIVMVNGQMVKELCTLEALPTHLTLNGTLPAFPVNPQQKATLGDIAFALDKSPLTIHVKPSDTEVTLHLITVGWGYGGPVGGAVRLHLEENAKLLLVEHIVGQTTTPLWLNTARQFNLASGAHLRHALLQNLPHTAIFTQTQQIHVSESAHYSAFTLQTGSHIARQESDIVLAANTQLAHHSLQLTGPGTTHDVTTRMLLTGPSPQCNVTQRNLVGGQTNPSTEEGGHAVFQGKYHVTQAAQQTDAYMRCENLLLHDSARVSQKPELEIYADDVKCSHGASTGSLDAEQLFYLKARGIDEATARQLLVSGFIEAQAEKFPTEVQPLIRPLITQAIKEVIR